MVKAAERVIRKDAALNSARLDPFSWISSKFDFLMLVRTLQRRSNDEIDFKMEENNNTTK